MASIWRPILLGQALSLLIAGTGVFSQLLANEFNISCPATQSLTLYVLLLLTFAPLALWRHSNLDQNDDFLRIWRSNWKVLVPLGVCDALANYLVVLAYRFTSITSVMLLDCVTVPAVMFLAFLPPLKARYSVRQLIGALVATVGLILLIISDAFEKHSDGQSGDSDAGSGGNNTAGSSSGPDAAEQKSGFRKNALLGDTLCVVGSCLYAISNVGQEWFVTHGGRNEGKGPIVLWLAAIGLFGTVFSTIELLVLERSELKGAQDWPSGVFLAFAGFAACLYTMYAATPLMMRIASATLFNLSLLTSDVFAVLASIVLFKHTPSPWYFVAFAIIAAGLAIYSSEGVRAEFKGDKAYSSIADAREPPAGADGQVFDSGEKAGRNSSMSDGLDTDQHIEGGIR